MPSGDILRPGDTVFIWATLKLQFESTASEFLLEDSWSWVAFSEICQESSPIHAYYWICPVTDVPKKQRRNLNAYRVKVTRLILRTAKEFWLPRRELIEDEHIKTMYEKFNFIPSSMRAKEREELDVATRIARFKRRLGGFYLLWALYWNQPTSPMKMERIEITAHDHKTMKAFANDLITLPIPLAKAGRTKLVEQVQFMMNHFVHSMAYDVCLFAESYHWKDITYLNTKYNGKAEILEWEKSLKERHLFHPKVKEAVAALKKKSALEREALRHFDNKFLGEALEFMKRRARGEVWYAADAARKAKTTGQNPSAPSEGPLSNSPDTTSLTEDPVVRLAKLLAYETLKSPYTLKDLIPPALYYKLRKARLARRQAAISSQQPSKDFKRAKANHKKAAARRKQKREVSEVSIDYGDVNNLAPVLQALSLTSDVKEQLEPILNEHFTRLLQDPKGSNCESESSTVSLTPSEWNLIYDSTAVKLEDIKQLDEELRKEDKKRDHTKPAKPENMSLDDEMHDSYYSTNERQDMPIIDETKTEVKSEPTSPTEIEHRSNHLEDLGLADQINRCEEALLQELISPSKPDSGFDSHSFPVNERVELENDISQVESERVESDDELNVEEILKLLTNYPGLLGELRKSPVRRKRKRKASLKVGKRGSKILKFS